MQIQVYEVVAGTYVPSGGTVYIVQVGTPITVGSRAQGNYQWNPAPGDPNNLGMTVAQLVPYSYAYVVGNGAGNYPTAAAAQTAANAYCTSLVNARNAANQTLGSGGDALGILSNSTVVTGPV